MPTAIHYKPTFPIRDADAEQFSPTDDQKYWMQIEETAVFQESSNIISCHFKPDKPYNLTSASGNKLTTFETTNYEPVAIYSRFKAPLYSVKYRQDGAILGVSTQDGLLQFFDVHIDAQNKHKPRNPIRTFKAHKSQIGAFDYNYNGRIVASFADDGHIKLINLSTDNSEPTWNCKAHADFIRTGAFSRNTDYLLASGSYDHTIRLWDTRQNGENYVREFMHESPVERIIFLPDENLLASAAGTIVYLWDLKAGKMLHKLNIHRKTITSLCLATNGKFLLTGGVDRRVNVVELDTGKYDPVHSFKMESPVLSLAIDEEDNCMAFGLGNKLAIYRRREEKEEKKLGRNRRNSQGKHDKAIKDELITTPQKIGKNKEKQQQGLFIVERERGVEAEKIQLEITERQLEQIKLGDFDYLLREGNMHELVRKLFSIKDPEPEYVVAVLQQIRIRQQLDCALSNQETKILEMLFIFLRNHLFEIPFFDILFAVAVKTLDIYIRKPLTTNVRKSLESFEQSIAKEISAQRELCQTMGLMKMMLDPIRENVKTNDGR